MKHSLSAERSRRSSTVNSVQSGPETCPRGRGENVHPIPSGGPQWGHKKGPGQSSSPKTCHPETPTLPNEGSFPIRSPSPASIYPAASDNTVRTMRALAGLCTGPLLSAQGHLWTGQGPPDLPSLPHSNICSWLAPRPQRTVLPLFYLNQGSADFPPHPPNRLFICIYLNRVPKTLGKSWAFFSKQRTRK